MAREIGWEGDNIKEPRFAVHLKPPHLM